MLTESGYSVITQPARRDYKKTLHPLNTVKLARLAAASVRIVVERIT
ncbi:hypothetical protein [Xenorhabdus bovienii]|nr:hypothetical protein [Xenorhabdus bovienii]MDE9432683.1 hypothetical protein [Xenorhabdus bovienii]MDE9490459.1 hypothetical protein [Xenorhabdus bovienii]MDE9506735.1 hypothetical protein [Xenorhabdus bovienii]MDE9547251.1 hypothetical protein [Xenorhabdus bovienii]